MKGNRLWKEEEAKRCAGDGKQQGAMFSYVSLEERMPGIIRCGPSGATWMKF